MALFRHPLRGPIGCILWNHLGHPWVLKCLPPSCLPFVRAVSLPSQKIWAVVALLVTTKHLFIFALPIWLLHGVLIAAISLPIFAYSSPFVVGLLMLIGSLNGFLVWKIKVPIGWPLMLWKEGCGLVGFLFMLKKIREKRKENFRIVEVGEGGYDQFSYFISVTYILNKMCN